MINDINKIKKFLQNDKTLYDDDMNVIVQKIYAMIYEIYHENKNNDYIKFVNHFNIEIIHDANYDENMFYLIIEMNYYNKYNDEYNIEKYNFLIDCENDVCYENDNNLIFERYFELLKTMFDFIRIDEIVKFL